MERLDHTNIDFERLSELCSPFIQDLVVFVVTRMHDDLESFLKANCRAVDDDEELHKHRYWDMFQDYSQLLESKLSVFVDKHNMTAHSFYAALLEAQTQDKMAATIIQYLLGATEYRRFVDLLIDRKMFHFGPGSAHALASTSGRGHGGDNLSNGSGGCENGIDAGKKVSNEGGVTGTDTGAGASKSSDEPDNTREQNNTRDDGRQDEVASDFSRKVSEPDLRGDQNAGGKDSERDLDSESLRK